MFYSIQIQSVLFQFFKWRLQLTKFSYDPIIYHDKDDEKFYSMHSSKTGYNKAKQLGATIIGEGMF